jgi:hypothetical protein
MVDNGKQFDNQDFREFCDSTATKVVFASGYHPQFNRLVERANEKNFSAIRKRLLDDKRVSGPSNCPKSSRHSTQQNPEPLVSPLSD